MQNNNKTNRQSNKTTNLSRAIIMLVKNADYKREKTLLGKIETACYELIDVTHNDETKIRGQLSYIHDLMIMARQVNIFLEENTIFIIGVIGEISKIYETKLEVSNEEIINEKIRDILEGGEMSEMESVAPSYVVEKDYSRILETKDMGIKRLATKNLEAKLDSSKLENIKDKKSDSLKLEVKNENKFSGDVNEKSINLENNRKLSRKEEVIKTLSHTSVSIREIAEKVLGCSEKTIQRELNNLVDLGIANRIGEKRWSRYVLA